MYYKYICPRRAVARSKNPGGLVVLGGDNVPPLVEIGLTDLTKTGGAKAPLAPPGDSPVGKYLLHTFYVSPLGTFYLDHTVCHVSNS
jgi:hypothetical protein